MPDTALTSPELPPPGTTMGHMKHKRNLRHAAAGSGGKPRNYPWPLLLIAAPAAVAIWSGWVGLGGMCGFGPIHPLPGIVPTFELNTAITLPVGVESYGAYALYVWLGGRGSQRTREFARKSALGALALGCLGQVVFHLLAAAHWTEAPPPVVVLVACLPVVTLSLAAALVHLTRADIRAAEQAEAERAAKAEARAAAKAELPARPKMRKRPARNRKPTGTGTAERPAVAPEPEPAPAVSAAEPAAEETVDLDAEARILQALADGQIDAETGILQLVAAGRSPSRAGKLAGRSDSYGRQVARKAKELTEAAPAGGEGKDD